MMNPQEQQMITGLFDKLHHAEQQAGPREAVAESAIRDALTQQPNAPYYMAQTILVQEHALNNLHQRLQELENTLAEKERVPAASGGGFFANLFGASPAQPRNQNRPAAVAGAGPFQNGRQGSFLGTAMTTAVGVAGGMLLANAVTGAFASDTPATEDPAAEPPADEVSAGDDYDADGGGDFDDEF